MTMTLSHLVTTYNYAHLLPQHLNGVLIQSRRPDPVVVSDDASPKDTPEAVRAGAETFPGAEVRLAEVNQGSAVHVQRLVASVKTDAYITMSADDWLVDPQFYADALDILERHPNVVAVYGHYQFVNPEGRPLAPVTIHSSDAWTLQPGPELRHAMALDNVISGICTVVRTERRLPIPAYPIANEYCTDWLHYYLLTLSGDFARINRIVCHYRVQDHGLNQMHTRSGLAIQRRDEGYLSLLDWPDLDEADRARLRIGRMRHLVRATPVWQLPSLTARFGRDPHWWPLLAAALAERANAHLTRLSTDLARRGLATDPG